MIGIDPAPAKGLAIFDGTDQVVGIREVHDFMASLKGEDLLLCWDAPLTGPSDDVRRGAGTRRPSEFTQRPVEAFFRRERFGFKAPKGIAVQGYAGCQHWTISRALLGLPRVGPWDRDFDELPFQLASKDEQRPKSGRWVVEVHPALAVWLWCRDAFPEGSWEFKKDDGVLQDLWNEVVKQTGDLLQGLDDPQTDDVLDARVAYALGRLWIEGSGEVQLLGSLEDGTFLLPTVPGIFDEFEEFRAAGVGQTRHRL